MGPGDGVLAAIHRRRARLREHPRQFASWLGLFRGYVERGYLELLRLRQRNKSEPDWARKWGQREVRVIPDMTVLLRRPIIGETIAVALGKPKPITLPYWLVYTLALPFDLIKKLTGKDLAISSNRVQKLTTPTYFRAEKVHEAGFEPSFTNIEGLQNMAKWFKETGQ